MSAKSSERGASRFPAPSALSSRNWAASAATPPNRISQSLWSLGSSKRLALHLLSSVSLFLVQKVFSKARSMNDLIRIFGTAGKIDRKYAALSASFALIPVCSVEVRDARIFDATSSPWRLFDPASDTADASSQNSTVHHRLLLSAQPQVSLPPHPLLLSLLNSDRQNRCRTRSCAAFL